ncbi:MAG: ParB/RepB/Spo0J family partition protein [Chloroflexota bacterium]|nr:ParB/RepB/Spo0J family partition protein [Chloroflexota bacterium]
MSNKPDRPERHQGLGRGLSALIPQRTPPPGPIEIPVRRIMSNPYQPRRRIDEEALKGLRDSILEHGVIQPILVTETIEGYRLVAGERRLRAAELAGLERIPAVVRQLADPGQLELALVENLQREDLDAMEEAHAYRQLIEEFGFTQETVARRVGRARSTVANTLRLLELEPSVQAAIGDGRLTEGHGRTLVGLEPEVQARLLDSIVGQALSVRQTEELVRRLREPRPTAAAPKKQSDPDLERVEEDLRRSLGTKVSLARTRRGGRIVIEYYSDEELGRLYERLTGGKV